MRHSRLGACGRSLLAAVVSTASLSGIVVAVGESPAEAAVTSVKGEACSYYINVGLFGGPQAPPYGLNGCNEGENSNNSGQSRPPAAGTNTTTAVNDPSYSPHVRISGTGGDQTAIDDNGAKGVYGPATIHGGKWPCEDPGTDPNGDGITGNCPVTAPPSGPQRAATSGSAASGTVSASAEIKLDPRPTSERHVGCSDGWGPICVNEGGFGPFPVSGDQLNVSCSANEAGVSGSATFVNAELALTTDAEGDPVILEDVPDNPPPNYTRHGVITNVGDVFSVVYNEQIKNSDGSLTVIGTHVYLMGPTAVGELVRGKVTCGVTPNSVTPTDTVNPTCGTPVIKPMGPEEPTPQVPHSELVGTFDAGIGNVRHVTDAATTAGSKTVTSATANFQAADVNGPVVGTGIPVNAYITAVNSATSAQISANATTTGTGRALSITRPQGLASITNVSVTNGTVRIGDEDSVFNYLKFIPGQTGPLPINATRTDEAEAANLPLAWSFDATDTSGNTVHCRGVHDLVATDDTYGSPVGSAVDVAAPGVLGNDADAEGLPLSAGLATGPAHGDVTLNPDGSFTYDRDLGYIGPDSFTYTLSDGAGGTDTGTVTINVTGPTTLTVGDILVNEGNSATTPATFTVTRLGKSSGQTIVSYKTGGGTATAEDYTAVPSGTLSFAPGETSKQVTVNVTGDTVPEKEEKFILSLFGQSTGTVMGDAAATAIIRNDDGATYLSVASMVVPEGGPANFTVTRYGNTTSTSTVTAKVAGGNATAGTDYNTVADQVLSFGANETSKTVTVTVNSDTVAEPNETFNLVLSGQSSGTTLADPSATAYIDDDDGATAAPSATFLSIDNIWMDETNGGTPTANFTATRYGDTSTAVTVSYKTSGGTATAGSDYSAQLTGSITFGIGETTKPVVINMVGDTVPEKDETLNVVLFGPPKGTVLGDSAGTASILNDDGTTDMAVGNLEVSEGNSGTNVVQVPVTRSGNTTAPATVKAKTGGGSAIAGTDYTAVTGIVLNFAAGETTKTVPVTVAGDTAIEGDETFNVSLFAPGLGVTLSDASGTTTIINDDA